MLDATPDEIARVGRIGPIDANLIIGDLQSTFMQRTIAELKQAAVPMDDKHLTAAELREELESLVTDTPPLKVGSFGRESLVHRLLRYASVKPKYKNRIDGLGKVSLETLVDAGLVRGFGDLYGLRSDQLIHLKRLIRISPDYAQKLLKRIADSKQQGLARLLNGISIRHVGARVAGILAQGFRRIDELQGATIDQINSILRKSRRGDTAESREADEGQNKESQVIARSIYEFLRSDWGSKTIAALALAGVKMEEEQYTAESLTLNGKTFVVTGTLKKYTRDEIQQQIIRNGGHVTSGVTTKTDYLIAGESPGTKLEKAKALGTRILTEEEFDQLLN